MAENARAIARHGFNARQTSPSRALTITRPIQNVTKTNVIEKFRSGAGTPVRPVQTTSTSSPTPIAPASTSVPRFTSRRETRSAGGTGGPVLDPRLAPAEQEPDEGDDQDDQRAVDEQPLRERQILLADQPVGRGRLREERRQSRHRRKDGGRAGGTHAGREVPQGLTVISASGVAVLWSSSSKMPSISAGTENFAFPPASTSM